MIDDTEAELIAELRKEKFKQTLDRIRTEYGDFADFSPEQWGEEGGSLGDVFVTPDSLNEYVKFTNVKSHQIESLFWVNWMADVDRAAHSPDPNVDLDFKKIGGYLKTLYAYQNGWSAHMYSKTATPLGPLSQPALPKKPGILERRRLKKQGGWE